MAEIKFHPFTAGRIAVLNYCALKRHFRDTVGWSPCKLALLIALSARPICKPPPPHAITSVLKLKCGRVIIWISSNLAKWHFSTYTCNNMRSEKYIILKSIQYIYREVDKNVSLQRCSAFFAAALLYWKKYTQFIFCCRAISIAGDIYQCHITGCLCYQLAAQQCMVQFGTPSFGPIHTPNIGPIDGGLISISAMKSQP